MRKNRSALVSNGKSSPPPCSASTNRGRSARTGSGELPRFETDRQRTIPGQSSATSISSRSSSEGSVRARTSIRVPTPERERTSPYPSRSARSAKTIEPPRSTAARAPRIRVRVVRLSRSIVSRSSPTRRCSLSFSISIAPASLRTCTELLPGDVILGPVKVYTRGGDQGETSLFGGRRVRKDDLRVEAYGAVDELNSILGVALTEISDEDLR